MLLLNCRYKGKKHFEGHHRMRNGSAVDCVAECGRDPACIIFSGIVCPVCPGDDAPFTLLTHWNTEEMPSSSIKVLRRLVQHYSRFALHFGPPPNGTPRSQRASTCHCWRHGWHQGLLQVLESCWLDPRSSCHTPNELNGKALWDFEKLRWHAHCFGKFSTEQSKLLCTSNRHTHTHTQYNCITFPDKNYPPRWMTSEDSNRCRFYQRGHLVLLLLQGICRTASSCRSNTTSRAGRKGAAKFNLPHCGYLGWDHWSHSLEHTYQWSLYSRTWDLRFPRSPPRLFFWILLHTDYEILQDISGTVWRVFEGMLNHMLSLDLQSIYNIFSSSIFEISLTSMLPICVYFSLLATPKKPLHIFSWQSFLLDGKANPRLDIVVQTINHCSVNVVHFAIVFLAIFLCYAFAGHFLLGHKNKGWDSMLGSLYALVNGVVYGGCLWLLSTSSGCVLFLVVFIPNSGTTSDAEYALLHRLWFLCVCKDARGCTLDIICTDQGCRSNSEGD